MTPLGPSVADPLDLLEECDLVERAKRDPQAFGRLYERHRLRVYQFACSRLRNSHDAEDVTSDVFLRAWQGIGRYQSTSAPFTAWLYRIASNAVVDQQRKHRGIVEDIDQHRDLAAAGSIEDVVAERDRVRRIGLVAQRLPARQRTVFALSLSHDLTHNAIARRIGRRRGAVKLLQYRAVAGVRAGVRAEADAVELAS